MKTRTRLALGFGGQVLLAAILGIGMLIGLAKMKREFSFVVARKAPVIANAQHLSKLVADMETGQRGFCVVQKEEFLAPYTDGAKEFDRLMGQQKKLVSDDPHQVAALERIEDLVAKWKEQAAEPEIAMARKVASNAIDAQHLQETLGRGVGKELMDQTMALGHEIELAFSGQGDWEGAFVVEIIEKCITDREAGERGFLITGEEEFLEKYAAGEQLTLPANFARLRAIVSSRGRDDELANKVDRLEQLTEEWTRRAAEPEIAARRVMNEHPESLKDVAALLEEGPGKALIDQLRAEFDNFIELEEELSSRRLASATQAAVKSRNTAFVLLFLALCLGLGLAVTTSRAIATPLAELVRGAESVGSGNLDTQVEIESTNEIGELGNAFNTMTGKLKEASSRRKQAEESLLTMQKLESLGILAGGIAHDFNNSLTGIQGNLSLAKLEVDSDSELYELIMESMEACRSASSLTSQLLTFAKGGNPIVKVAALGPILQETCTFAARGSQARCVFAIDDDLLPAKVDRNQLAQALQNLVINASQAMPGGGTITVSAGNVVVKADDVLPLSAGAYVVISVKDQGDGIAADRLTKIFDPYFSTKIKGQGLGLATCHSIVAKHDGHIAAESKMGAGTTFTMHLPAADPADIPAETRDVKITTGTGNMLVMDDEPMVARTLVRTIERLGYRCESVADGAQALASYQQALESGRPFDAVIMDLTIPGGMGGKEAVRRLQELDPKARAIVSSGYSNDPIMSDHAQHGFVDVLSKPYRLEEVSAVLRRVLGPTS